MLQQSTGQSKNAEEQTANQLHKFADNASKRYQRMLKWMEAEGTMDDKHKLEKMRATIRMAKASALSHQRFGEAAEVDATDTEKAALVQAQEMLKNAREACEGVGQKDKDQLEYE